MNKEQEKLTRRIFTAQIIFDKLKIAMKTTQKHINDLRIDRYNKFGGLKPNCLKKEKQWRGC